MATSVQVEAAAAKLRAELGLPADPPVLATGGEIRALRHALRLTQTEFAHHLGLRERALVGLWEREKAPVRLEPATAARLTHALNRARELGALTERPRRRHTVLRYKCGGCGKPIRSGLIERRTVDGLEEISHRIRAGKRCGPVQEARR